MKKYRFTTLITNQDVTQMFVLGVNTDRYGIIRFSFGLSNTREDVEYLFKYLPQILKQLKEESAKE